VHFYDITLCDARVVSNDFEPLRPLRPDGLTFADSAGVGDPVRPPRNDRLGDCRAVVLSRG
jgi:hypothetical protein